MKVAIERPFDGIFEDIRGMVLPQSHIDEILEQEPRDLNRCVLEFVLEPRLTADDKARFVRGMYTL